MLQDVRIKRLPERVAPDLGAISVSLLERDATIPFTIRQLNNLPQGKSVGNPRRDFRSARPALGQDPHSDAERTQFRRPDISECQILETGVWHIATGSRAQPISNRWMIFANSS